MCSKSRISLIFLCLAFFLALPSAQAMNLSLVGGINRHHPSTNPDPPAGSVLSPQNAFSLGLLADTEISENYRFEFGAIRHARKTLLEGPVSSTESSYRGWLIPLTFRFMRADFLGFGFGPYLGFMNAGSFEMGLRVNLRIVLPIWGDLKGLLDGSYLIGFTDMNKSPVAEDKNQELLFLIGLQIPLFNASSTTPENNHDPRRE